MTYLNWRNYQTAGTIITMFKAVTNEYSVSLVDKQKHLSEIY